MRSFVTIILTALTLSLNAAPITNPPPSGGKPQEWAVAQCVVVVAVLATGWYAICAIKTWCDQHLGTTNTPPTLTNCVPCVSLVDPAMGPAPLTVLSASHPEGPWDNRWTLDFQYLGTNVGKVLLYSNGIYLAERIAPIENDQCHVDFGVVTTNLTDRGFFRLTNN